MKTMFYKYYGYYAIIPLRFNYDISIYQFIEEDNYFEEIVSSNRPLSATEQKIVKDAIEESAVDFAEETSCETFLTISVENEHICVAEKFIKVAPGFSVGNAGGTT